jgi:hypothetical protein
MLRCDILHCQKFVHSPIDLPQELLGEPMYKYQQESCTIWVETYRHEGALIDERLRREGPPMLNLSTVSTLLGAAFGLRFGVLILFPVMALELAIVAVNSFAIGESVGRLAIVMSLVATSSQLGYLGGSIVAMTEAA